MDLLEWLEKFCDKLNESENPFSYDSYQIGFNSGCHKTRREILMELRCAGQLINKSIKIIQKMGFKIPKLVF